MTREEILSNSIWTSGKLTVYSDFFKQEVKLELITSDYNLDSTNAIISEKFVACVNDFISLPEEDKPAMKELLYKHCMDCCEQISYGFELQQGETEQQASLREFGVTNEDSAFEKAALSLSYALIQEDEFLNNRFVKIVFYPEWETEHGCELILKNGRLLDYTGEGDTYLGQFDE